jgi:hypothetical protein
MLAHPDTHAAAGALLRVLASRADDEMHAELEVAVRAAGERAVGAGMRRDRIVDELLGCLDMNRVTGEQAVARLATLAESGGPPALTPHFQMESRWGGRYSLLDRLSEIGASVSAELAAAVDRLDEAVVEAGSGGSSEDVQAARDRMPDLFVAADQVCSNVSVPAEVRLLIARSAALLAGDGNALPDTDLGRRVITVLLDAAGSEDEGRALS